MYHLAKYPAWADAARAEVLRVVGPSRATTYDDLAELPTVAAVLHESMRLMPPVATTIRMAVRDVVLRRKPPTAPSQNSDSRDATAAAPDAATLTELHVKAGTTVSIGLSHVQRNPALWGEQAHCFDPQRFMGGVAAALRHPMAYMPFTAGPRACIGQHFALIEARVILATVLQRAEWALAPSYKHCALGNVTLTPRHGMPMRVWRRGEPAPAH